MFKRWKEKFAHFWYLASMSPQKREWRNSIIRLGNILQQANDSFEKENKDNKPK